MLNEWRVLLMNGEGTMRLAEEKWRKREEKKETSKEKRERERRSKREGESESVPHDIFAY